MTAIKQKLKRFFKSHIFRIILFAVIFFSTVFFPLVFAYPRADMENKNLLIVFIAFACLFELLLYIIINHYLIDCKVSSAIDHLQNMTHERDVKRILPDIGTHIDNTADDMVTAVNATADEYVRLAQVRKSFVANASHELRTPLTSIQGFLQAVLDGTADEANKEKYLKIALTETKRLNTLINSMLDLSRLDSGKNPLILGKFNVNDIIKDIVAKFEPDLIKKALQINVEFARETCYVYADKEKIIRVLTNLIDNAIKYSPAYSRILVTTSIRSNKAYITVKDFGYGISKKDQMFIWDTFYMTDRSRTPVKAKGSGLGLSIVKKIIDDHGEVIWVESNRGAGATFIFTLTLFDQYKHKNEYGKIIKDEPSETIPQTEI